MASSELLCKLDYILNKLSFLDSQIVTLYKAKGKAAKSVVTPQDLAKKQDLLVSGVNIKRINGQDILGPGDLIITGDGTVVTDNEVTEPLIGIINNSNVAFTTTYDFDPDTDLVFVNGFKQKKPEHYYTSGTNIIIFTSSPEVGDILEINYKRI